MPYSHTYTRTDCPICHADLTLPSAVAVDGRGNDGMCLGTSFSSLDPATGELYEDGAGFLSSGQHAGTLCAKCCSAAIENYER